MPRPSAQARDEREGGFRRDIRRGIQDITVGKYPQGLSREEGKPITTYCNDTVVRVPPAPTLEEDKVLMRETGRRLAEEYIRNRSSSS